MNKIYGFGIKPVKPIIENHNFNNNAQDNGTNFKDIFNREMSKSLKKEVKNEQKSENSVQNVSYPLYDTTLLAMQAGIMLTKPVLKVEKQVESDE